MKKLAYGIFAGVMAIMMFVSTNAQAQMKIGVIDTRTVLSGLPEAQAAQAKIEASKKMWEDSLTTIRVQYQAKSDAYSKIADTMSPEMKRKASEELQGMQDTFNKFRDSKLGQDGELTQMSQNTLKPIFDKVQAQIAAFAKKEKLTVVFDKTSTLFVEPGTDMTDKFSAFLKGAK